MKFRKRKMKKKKDKEKERRRRKSQREEGRQTKNEIFDMFVHIDR